MHDADQGNHPTRIERKPGNRLAFADESMIAIESQSRDPANCQFWLMLTVILLGSSVIMAHAILILGGKWEGDEWAHFAHFMNGGIGWLGYRMLTWSPRPASEFALYIYYLAISSLHAPLITPFLTTLWVIMIGSIVAAIVFAFPTERMHRLTLAVSTLCMFLLGHKIFEMFYWPMAAAAYILALTGMTVVAFRILSGGAISRRERLICCGSLCLAAASSETGEFFVVGFTGAMAILDLTRLLRGEIRKLKNTAWYLIPLLLCAGLLAVAFRFRVGNATSGVGPTDVYFHQFGVSFLAMLQDMPERFLSIGSPASDIGLSAGVAMKVLLFVGAVGASRQGLTVQIPWRQSAALACGLVAAISVTSLAAYFQYSNPGSEHHDTFQQCAITLLILLAAQTISPWWPVRSRTAGVIWPLMLTGAIVVGMWTRLPHLIADYALLQDIRTARQETWASGNDPSVRSVRFVQSPQGKVLHYMWWQPAHFLLHPGEGAEPAWNIKGVLEFFRKSEMDLLPPLDRPKPKGR